MSGGVCRQQGDYAVAIINVWTSFSSSSFRYSEARASQHACYTHAHTLRQRRELRARPLNSEGSLAHLCKLDKGVERRRKRVGKQTAICSQYEQQHLERCCLPPCFFFLPPPRFPHSPHRPRRKCKNLVEGVLISSGIDLMDLDFFAICKISK